MYASIVEEIKARHEAENRVILERRSALLMANPNPQVGDWVIFNDCERRISYLWVYDENAEVKPVEGWGVQTSNPHSSYYMGEGFVSYSGSLYQSIPGALLEATDEVRNAPVWFFDRDHRRAGGGVTFLAPFKVWRVNQDAPND